MKKLITMLMLAAAMGITTRAEAQAQTIPVWKLADLKAAMDSAEGPTIINFWATFCKPCIAELPYFQAAANQYKEKGVKLVMVSLDLKEAYPKTIAAFARGRKLTSPVVFLDESNADLFVPAVDSSWSGAIPASLFINPKRGYRYFVEEELSKAKLDAEIKKMLGE
jgi:thiol-disulfide isomerase/thioredoxin